MEIKTFDGLEYACATGKLKKWAREKLILNALYETNEEQAEYLKIKDTGLLPVSDKMTDDYLTYRFGYQYRVPKTDITLYISKKDKRMFIKRGDIGYGWDEVEKAVYKFIEEQIKRKNVYLQTNLNHYEFIIK